eukprot:3884443-Rhodomonas_salina.1
MRPGIKRGESAAFLAQNAAKVRALARAPVEERAVTRCAWTSVVQNERESTVLTRVWFRGGDKCWNLAG